MVLNYTAQATKTVQLANFPREMSTSTTRPCFVLLYLLKHCCSSERIFTGNSSMMQEDVDCPSPVTPLTLVIHYSWIETAAKSTW